MTSQQLKTKLEEAVSIIAQCERLLDGPHAAAEGWEIVCLQNRVRDFMDLHRAELRDGGCP